MITIVSFRILGEKIQSSIAHRLKFKYKMNPLLVTFSPLIINKVGNHNREELIKSGFDSIFLDQTKRYQDCYQNVSSSKEVTLKVHWDAGINASQSSMALKFNIKLLFYAEHGESEYGEESWMKKKKLGISQR